MSMMDAWPTSFCAPPPEWRTVLALLTSLNSLRLSLSVTAVHQPTMAEGTAEATIVEKNQREVPSDPKGPKSPQKWRQLSPFL